VLETRSVVDALRSEVQRRILSGDIPPGATLPEQWVAQKFDVARPTAKAAIEQLVNLGLLRRSHNKTASVPLFDAADVTDLYLSRAVVENAVVSLLAERGTIPASAVEVQNRLRGMVKQKDKVAEFVKCDIDFHHALVTATGSPRLSRLHASVIGEAHLCMAQVQVHHLLHPQVIADEHTRILAAIEARDPDQARQEMSIHISRARDKFVGYIKRHKTAKAG
jgi:DNA-binding GntR family transcriptional regulator